MIVDRWKKLQSYIATKVRLGGVLPNDGYITGVPKNIFRGGNFVGTTGTGLQTLLSFTFPAKSLKSDLDIFHATLAGGFGANDDNKRARLSFNGTVLFDTGLIDYDGFGFYINILCIRLSSTQVNIGHSLVSGVVNIDSGGAVNSTGERTDSQNSNILTVSNMDSASNILLLEGESSTATNNNVFWNLGKIELTRFA